ncbi:uncharacterized protein YqgV (UPF0045/DUF77 family) [Kibdelosporangium banguiense]|uniref:Uncharacterized protein YqgV (UPF0045/DUF77 family) n=1 Tax=Kibdelosporangium banguiense TaxID=1365924 RepID=A0ABS4TFV3_9PSEU|nr:uncharacterized protein YqgV (UPF0045/DUF77 family) [Kibdelosporangium banguiense]
MLVAFSVSPLGGESDSVAKAVAQAVRVVRESGLPNRTSAMFTEIEGATFAIDYISGQQRQADRACERKRPRLLTGRRGLRAQGMAADRTARASAGGTALPIC